MTNNITYDVIDDNEFKKALTSFKTSQTKFKKLAVTVSLQAIAHANLNDDPQKIVDVYTALDTQTHRDQFQRWVESYTPWKLKKKEDDNGKVTYSFRKNQKLVKEQKEKDGEEFDENVLYDFPSAVANPFLEIDLGQAVKDDILKQMRLNTYHKKIQSMIDEIEKMDNGEAKNKTIDDQDYENVIAFKDHLKTFIALEREEGRTTEAS